MRIWLLSIGFCLASAVAAAGQFGEPKDTRGPKLDQEVVQCWQVGLVVTAQGGPCTGLVGTVPMPTDWPEQTVKVVDEDFSPFVRDVAYRMVGGTVKQMVVTIPRLPAGEEARAVIKFEVSRYSLLPPEETGIFVSPPTRDLPKDVRLYLGASPYIESQNRLIKSAAKEIAAANKEKSDWEKVEAIYDWVREHVEYKEGPLKGAVAALKDKHGDCEELTSLFIALCRASSVPARTVWVPGHCYPEFYLEDEGGQGYWFPCQAAGSRAFGGIPEHRPILQKGDNFRTPQRPREAQRYVSEHLTGAGGKPKVRFIRELLDAAE